VLLQNSLVIPGIISVIKGTEEKNVQLTGKEMDGKDS